MQQGSRWHRQSSNGCAETHAGKFIVWQGPACHATRSARGMLPVQPGRHIGPKYACQGWKSSISSRCKMAWICRCPMAADAAILRQVDIMLAETHVSGWTSSNIIANTTGLCRVWLDTADSASPGDEWPGFMQQLPLCSFMLAIGHRFREVKGRPGL